MIRTGRIRKAFTLIELVIVMLLLSLMAAIVAPRLSGFVMGRKVDEETRRFVALTRFAREEAISRGERLSIVIATDGKSYSLRPAEGTGNDIVAYDCEEKLTIALPDVEQESDEETEILFWPDGTLDPDSPTVLQMAEDGTAAVEFTFDAKTSGFMSRRLSDAE